MSDNRATGAFTRISSFLGEANDVYPDLVKEILSTGEGVEVRSTQTLELHPAVIELEHPERRLVTSFGRPVNVAFALAEVLWILCGHKDVSFLAPYNSNIASFSDDGQTFNAAYGWRLRYEHGFDQLEDVIYTLRADGGSRQATLCIWAPGDRGWTPVHEELAGVIGAGVERHEVKDRACNLISHLMIRDGVLDWLQIMRSNDAIWGVPYNWMQWTSLQEWVAIQLEVPVGRYIHIADSLHLYTEGYYGGLKEPVRYFDLYSELEQDDHYPIIGTVEEMRQVLSSISRGRDLEHKPPSPWWSVTAQIMKAHRAYTAGNDMEAYRLCFTCDDVVFGAAQIRLYAQNRWINDPDKYAEILKRIGSADWPGPVVEWMLARAQETAPLPEA